MSALARNRFASPNTTHRIWHLDNGLDDLLARGCNLLESDFTANPGQREALGICFRVIDLSSRR